MHLDDDSIPIPEPDEYFEKRIWAMVSGEIEREHKRNWFWLLVLAALIVAFFVGRYTKAPDGVTAIAYLPPKQVLTVAMVDHLERSKAVLLETANVAPQAVQTQAEELLSTNRLLRRSLQSTGDLKTAELLEELERILLEVAHSTETLNSDETTALRARIREQGLLLRVRLIEQSKKQNSETAE